MKELLIRQWRVMDAIPFGKLVWFDPDSEGVELHALAEGMPRSYVDKPSSVSAPDEDEDRLEPGDQIKLFDGLPRPEEGLPF